MFGGMVGSRRSVRLPAVALCTAMVLTGCAGQTVDNAAAVPGIGPGSGMDGCPGEHGGFQPPDALSPDSSAPPTLDAPASDAPTPDAPGADAPPSGTPLAADFVPVSASRCTTTFTVLAGQGEWMMRDDQVATGPFDALVRALRTPSEQGDEETICTADAVAVPVITLTDARGRTTVPAVPTDVCGKPQRATMDAIAALPWKSVTRTKLRQSRTQLEMDSSCPGAYKPMIALTAAEPARGATEPLFAGTAPTTLTVCRYKLHPSETISLAGSAPAAVGALDSAVKLTPAATAQLVGRLNAAPVVSGGV